MCLKWLVCLVNLIIRANRNSSTNGCVLWMSVRQAHRYRVLEVDRTVQLIQDAHVQFVVTPSPTYGCVVYFLEQNILRGRGIESSVRETLNYH